MLLWVQCPKTRWRSCPACQQRIQEQELEDEYELQSWFIRRINRFLAAQGKQLIGWDEILEGGLAEGACVMSWRVSSFIPILFLAVSVALTAQCHSHTLLACLAAESGQSTMWLDLTALLKYSELPQMACRVLVGSFAATALKLSSWPGGPSFQCLHHSSVCCSTYMLTVGVGEAYAQVGMHLREQPCVGMISKGRCRGS